MLCPASKSAWSGKLEPALSARGRVAIIHARCVESRLCFVAVITVAHTGHAVQTLAVAVTDVTGFFLTDIV